MNTLESILEKHAAYLRGDPRGERANLFGVDLSWKDLAFANLADADLTEADLSHANLTKADLTGAEMSKANLTYADLSRANLTDVNLRNANLTGANMTGAFGRFITFQLGQHQAIFAGGYGSIGCIRYSYEEWIYRGAEIIDRNNNYSDAEIQRYMRWIKDAIEWLADAD